MPRFKLRTLLLIVAGLAPVLTLVYLVINFDKPFAVVLVSSDSKAVLSTAAALKLCASALRLANLEPISPERAYGKTDDPDSYVGRNATRPEDRASVIWHVRDYDRPFSVYLERTSSGIVGRVNRSWL